MPTHARGAYKRDTNPQPRHVIMPTLPQDRFIFSDALYPAFVAGFGSGKTEALILRSIIGKINYPRNDRGFYEPTYDLMRVAAWPRFEEILETNNVPYRLYRSPHNILKIEGCGKIVFRSMDTPGRIIAYEVADSDVDELDTLKQKDAQEVWHRILSRNRQKKPDAMPNTVGVATTPEGFRFVHSLWGRADLPHGYELIKAPTYSNPHLPEGYIDSLRAIYPENLIDAYIEGEFVNLTQGTIYASYHREKHRSKEKVEGKEPIYAGMDFNVTKQAVTVYVHRQSEKDGSIEWHAVDELVDQYDTPATILELKKRYPENVITVYPDASGKNRSTHDASISDLFLLQQAGFTVKVHETNPPVRNRIMAVNSAFDHGLLYVNYDRCPRTADCLEQQVYNDRGEPDKSRDDDHQNDATGYPIAHEVPIVKPVLITDISRFTMRH